MYKQKYAEFEVVINQKQFLEHLLNKFKREDEDFIEIEYVAEEKVKELLTNNRKVLEFALIAVVEALRKDPDRYLLIDKMALTTRIVYGQEAFPPVQPYGYDNTDLAREKVLEAADRLFNKLAKGLASDTIYTTANYFSKSTKSTSSSPLPLSLPSNSSSSSILPEQIDFHNRKQNSETEKKVLEVRLSPANDDFGEDEDSDIEEIQENHKSDFADL